MSVTAAALVIRPEFGWCIVAAAIMGFQCSIEGFAVVGARQAFKDEAFKSKPEVKAIEDQHKKDFPDIAMDPSGYPDMGDGRLAQHLPYRDWFKLASAQRAHYNYLENLSNSMGFTLLAGLFFPEAAAIAGAIIIVGRFLYGQGYRARGPLGRYPGGMIAPLATMALLGMTIFGAVRLTGVLKPFGL